MAIWQFDCMIIPKNRDVKEYQDFDRYISWLGVRMTEPPFEFLSKFLPVEKSWSNDIRLYGNKDSTCIEMYLLDNDIEEIRCRFDLRNISISLLNNIIEFINMINGIIVFNDIALEADIRNVIKLLKDSEAARFCNSPIDFIEYLDNTIN